MYSNLRVHFCLILSACFLFACGESDSGSEPAPKEQAKTTPATSNGNDSVSTEMKTIPNGVIYQEQIYKNWPYTEAPSATPAAEETTKADTVPEKSADTEVAATDNKPYKIVDGKISENALEGWRTFNGGGCGACHGQGASGGVGPNLGESVTKKLTKEQFIDVVTNGRPGTLMGPHKTNKRVMDNLDNLYAYFMARGDGVLGPENLIKFPMGKKE